MCSVPRFTFFFVLFCVLGDIFTDQNPSSEHFVDQVSGARFSDCRLQIAGVSGHCLLSC